MGPTGNDRTSINMPFIRIPFVLLLYALYIPTLVLSDTCPCGYSTGQAVFTDVLETDFTTIKEMAEVKDIWQVQDWSSPRNETAARYYTRDTTYGNVISGNPDGLQFMVRKPVGVSVGTSEIRSSRNDMKFGTFRMTMKTPKQSGTCAAFFWVCNTACMSFDCTNLS